MSKYHSRITEYEGIKFHSAKEARRYQELRLLEKAGEVTDLELQPKYSLDVNGFRIGFCLLDFRYRERGVLKVEDSKGYDNPMSRWKRKHLFFQYGIEVLTT